MSPNRHNGAFTSIHENGDAVDGDNIKSPSVALDAVLQRVRDGQLGLADARREITELHAQSLGFATLDHGRAHRCGCGEVIFAAGKTPDQVVSIAAALFKRQPAVLATRMNDAHVDAMREAFADQSLEIAERGGAAILGRPPALNTPPIAIVTAGTSDQPVAEEALFTCKALGQRTQAINDVGVAGLHRLIQRLPEIRRARVIIAIAGMEGAMPSVLAGLVEAPVIAVPTSVGYGAALGGLTALLGILTSCAAGVAAVNIDNGFGAAYLACRINHLNKP